MTNFVLKNPSVVLVHLPKTGGTSVRNALGGNVERRFFGHLPKDYRHLTSLAIIREPKARFLSAFRMFKYGNKLEGDYYAEPRWPDLTVSKALDVLEDPWIGYDRSQRSLDWNLKHHLLPQTHPFNCLHVARTIIRFETLDADFSRFCETMGLSAELPQLRGSFGKQLPEEPWSNADNERFEKMFGDDYHHLGYGTEEAGQDSEHFIYKLDQTRPTDQTVYDLWPVYFSDQKVSVQDAATSLPREDCALEPFADEIIPGERSTTWAGRSKDLIEHFHRLQPEFSGASRLSHLLACTIVVLRRDAECQSARTMFWRIMDEQFEVIRSELSLRWLVSISDTIADFGRTPGEQAVGLNASVFANSTKLYESELTVFHPKRPWPPKKRMSPGGDLFDGLITFWTEKGDLIENMFNRSSKIAEMEPTAGKVLNEVLERLRRGPTVYRRFSRIAGKPTVPVIEGRMGDRIRRIIKRNL
ncbi:sulfotransferase family 2 domain-containing protein [Phaeobacter gallaeciensis]|uniref:sulfotransferase family 2 domain-containing protein n=1 Tax=Phaeobacter gallaeciensis TaxID=60890 RepID=UPI0023804CCB|nr:sulfotransferase family 2 domain-containing protein [Phaeobacter gallaeciensis]MDE4276778.1 sulfotransferase family 2 domain-containing protein [Phaeobacter gallaeciensis]MDE4301993.1 sulfotransferase family 2 domain-containing protein [Phaeobacter gallaeciensis]MDE5187202.1 sulfotransferase family 2 domain-containing protein [Phaeobacter gallaeciensis]